ncbi:hypothetical protein AYO45_04360 [Gammaproteobacteria bacterium SCGC AG-212-F23]|nr:hypothetical protein AYO45_04360 [Gammaproteobacteria bacterium SCGC AG-212-F23]
MIDSNIFLIAIILFFISLILLFAPRKKNPATQEESQIPSSYAVSSQDIRAVAGDDILATQLDLARAYLEMGKKSLAQKILTHVSEHGNQQQCTEAKYLLDNI